MRRRRSCPARRRGALLLHKHRNALKALRLDERGDGGGRDVIGQVRAHDGRKAPELFAHQRGDIGLENIGGDDLEVIVARHCLFKDRQQRLVKLHGNDFPRALAELMTQSTDAGADLQHAVLLACARAFGDLEGNGGVDEEILTHAPRWQLCCCVP